MQEIISKANYGMQNSFLASIRTGISMQSTKTQRFDSFLETKVRTGKTQTALNSNLDKANTKMVQENHSNQESVAKSNPFCESIQNDMENKTEATYQKRDTEIVEGEEEKFLDEKLPEEVIANILSFLQEIVTIFQNEFSFTEDELMHAMQETDLSALDLLQFDSAKELFFSLQGVEAEAFLADEELYQDLEDFTKSFHEILKENDFPFLSEDGQKNQENLLNQLSEFLKTESENQDPKNLLLSSMEKKEEKIETKELVIDFEDLTKEEKEDSLQNLFEKKFAADMAEETEKTDFADHRQDDTSKGNQNFDHAFSFLEKLLGTKNANENTAVSLQNQSVDLLDIATQIINQVKLQIRPEKTTMEMQLNPEHLGKVELSLTSTSTGLRAKMTVQDDRVKEAVEAQMQVLRETLEAQGLKVESVEVTVSEFGFRFQDERGQENQQQKPKKQNKLSIDETMEETSENLTASDVSQVMKEMNGNRVDYVA